MGLFCHDIPVLNDFSSGVFCQTPQGHRCHCKSHVIYEASQHTLGIHLALFVIIYSSFIHQIIYHHHISPFSPSSYPHHTYHDFIPTQNSLLHTFPFRTEIMIKEALTTKGCPLVPKPQAGRINFAVLAILPSTIQLDSCDQRESSGASTSTTRCWYTWHAWYAGSVWQPRGASSIMIHFMDLDLAYQKTPWKWCQRKCQTVFLKKNCQKDQRRSQKNLGKSIWFSMASRFRRN